MLEHRLDHLADPGSPRLAEARQHAAREGIGGQHAGADGVERVVGQVRDPIRVADAERLRGGRRRVDLPGVGADPVAHLPGQVQVLEHLVDADALRGVVPAIGREVGRERLLAGVPERGVADVVAERDRLGQRLVEREAGRQAARDLRHLEGMGQAGDEVVALGVEEDLRLVLQAAEGLGMDDPVPVALEGGPIRVRLLRSSARPRLCVDRVRDRGEAFLLPFARQAIPADQLAHGPIMTDASSSRSAR